MLDSISCFYLYRERKDFFLTVVLMKAELKVDVTEYMFLHVRM